MKMGVIVCVVALSLSVLVCAVLFSDVPPASSADAPTLMIDAVGEPHTPYRNFQMGVKNNSPLNAPTLIEVVATPSETVHQCPADELQKRIRTLEDEIAYLLDENKRLTAQLAVDASIAQYLTLPDAERFLKEYPDLRDTIMHVSANFPGVRFRDALEARDLHLLLCGPLATRNIYGEDEYQAMIGFLGYRRLCEQMGITEEEWFQYYNPVVVVDK